MIGKRKLLQMLFLGLILNIGPARLTADRNLSATAGFPLSRVDHDNGVNCDTESRDIRTSLQKLSSGEYADIEQARRLLLGYARKSSACRKHVVQALMAEMDKPDLDLESQPLSWILWREGSRLLGDLKATEALDLLISHLDMTNGYHSASMDFQPAINGVVGIGPLAIPKLKVALSQSPDRNVRIAAAYCLTSIGGLSAMNALRKAQYLESNKCVAHFISISLRTFSYKSKSGHVLFDNEAPHADIDARRNWLMAFECID